MTHATEHITDPSVFRLRASATPAGVLFAWDYPGATLLRVRIQRSRDVFVEDPDDERRVVYDGVGGSFRDTGAEAGHEYFYTVWARHAEAPGAPCAASWVLWERTRIRAGGRSRLSRMLSRWRGRA